MISLLVTRRTILAVEDNAADAGLVADALGESPDSAATLVIAGSGRVALERLRDPVAGPLPDIVLLDLNLPGYSGLETLADIKADPKLRKIPVIVLTTSKSQSEVNRCYELGAAAVLNKPLRLHDYREMLRAFERFWFGHVSFPERL